MCDVQGFPSDEGTVIFTDAALHVMKAEQCRNEDRQYGATNRGTQGIIDFISSHKCNKVCMALNLQKLKLCKPCKPSSKPASKPPT